ncbi:hypothetical protein C1645_745830 [Glomus cerebriforme]|uniref:Uncharacterized protein n=1 Tax=Glomus cerebriforme TaxID=658196 RepID=A0A397RZB5_9GLOM|nr:hypothetical protein C1645_745830 [Glomus cerebriforme]
MAKLIEFLQGQGLGLSETAIKILEEEEIQDENKVFKRCMEEILGRLRSYGTLQPDSLEAMRNEYVVALLHASIHIVMDITDKELSMRPQYGIVGEESRGWVNFAIKWNPKQIVKPLTFRKMKVEKLAGKMKMTPMTLPIPMQDENNAALILKGAKAMKVDDPAIFVKWDANGFNDTVAQDVRNGVAGQTVKALITYITGSGGMDFNRQNSLFIFRDNMSITQCQGGFPQWAKHQAAIPDVCSSICRINKLSAKGAIDYELFEYPLTKLL